MYEKLAGRTVEITPKQTGWTSKVTFNLWEKYGKRRLYMAYTDYDRKGARRNHYQDKGYIDLDANEVMASPSTTRLVNEIVSKM